MALFAAALSVSSYIIFPLPFTPIVLSAQTVVVNLIGLVLTPKQAAKVVLLYLCMGFIGLPVFSGGSAGPAKLFGPTGGFFFGFLFAVTAISALKGKYAGFARYAIVTIAIGIPIQHLFAVAFYSIYTGANVSAAILTISIPFVLGDISKCLLSVCVGVEVNKALSRTARSY